MRPRDFSRPKPQFSLWTRGELLRLGVIACACAAPWMIEETGDRPQGARGDAAWHNPAQPAGRLRTVRMTPLDVSKGAMPAVGDADEPK